MGVILRCTVLREGGCQCKHITMYKFWIFVDQRYIRRTCRNADTFPSGPASKIVTLQAIYFGKSRKNNIYIYSKVYNPGNAKIAIVNHDITSLLRKKPYWTHSVEATSYLQSVRNYCVVSIFTRRCTLG